ncbi:ankyrin repeat domain-containing protein [Streptomyces sp. NPDC051639]|uniref:ankyrin repeat domain-containing protein n=1 Tax=Streptomyces sp. NPDC051639 TaxID=3155671 RepID=UPI00344ABF69
MPRESAGHRSGRVRPASGGCPCLLRHEQDAAAVGSLLAAGAGVDVPDEQGNTPLWQAVFTYRGDGEVLSLLVGAGADPDMHNLHGVSPRRLAGRRIGSDVAVHSGIVRSRRADSEGHAALAGCGS